MVRTPVLKEWYPNVDSTETGVPVSQSPTYAVHSVPKSNVRLQ
jgi:hypothetical protein